MKPLRKPFEIITTYTLKNNSKRFIGRYIVIATSTAKAITSLNLIDGEEIVEASELRHKLVIAK